MPCKVVKEAPKLFIMYEGSNPTALRSMDAISRAFLAVLREKPYSEVSINEVSARAQLTRQTFYNLYDEKDDIVRHLVRYIYRHSFNDLPPKAADPKEALLVFLKRFQVHSDVIKLLAESGASHLVQEEISRYVTALMEGFQGLKEDDPALPYLRVFLSNGFTSLLIEWSKHPDLSPEDVVGICLSVGLNGPYIGK